MLTVTTSADATNLLTVEEVRAVLRLTDSAEDAILAPLIASASDAIARHLSMGAANGKAGPTLARQRYVNTVPSFDDFLLQLDVWPIDTVEEVLIDGSEVSDYEVDTAESGLLSRESGWPWSGKYQGIAAHRLGGTEEPSVQVTLLAGYVLPSQTVPNEPDGIALPEQIKRAAIETVKDWWLHDQRDPAILGRNVLATGGASVQINYQAAAANPDLLPPRAVALLRPFRRIA